jgi:antitoxin component YwqK of YwqJK toxin-antitoxin module
MTQAVIGYKGFDNDLRCREFQYEIGKTYVMKADTIKLEESGFHFCRYSSDVLKYYDDDNCRYAVVEAKDKIIDDLTLYNKSVTNNITIIREITKDELIKLMPGQIERTNGDIEWYQNGKLHREDGPAMEYANGTKLWCQYGQVHRIDGPTTEYADGSKFWYQDGLLHRVDGPAAEYANGDKLWYQNGELHRVDGPAEEYANGAKEWYQNGKLQRIDCPALGDANGTKRLYLDGIFDLIR